MKFLTSIIIFFVAIIALVPEIILYFIFAMGAGLSGGSITGIAAFFVSLFIFTAAIAILAPICAIIELIVIKYVDIKRKRHKKHHKLVELFYKDTGSFLLITSLSVLLLLLILFMSFAVNNSEMDTSLQGINDEKTDVVPSIEKETGMTVTINGIEKKSIIGLCGEYGLGCDIAVSGKTFLIVDVTIENKGAGGFMSNYISSLDFKIKDSESYVYDSAYTSNLDQEFSSGEIQDGQKVRGKIAFEIPKTATELKLVFKSESFDLE
ncbi:MAG: DUF4352 domain-containing protein [Nanoarchaeota archaeon]